MDVLSIISFNNASIDFAKRMESPSFKSLDGGKWYNQLKVHKAKIKVLLKDNIVLGRRMGSCIQTGDIVSNKCFKYISVKHEEITEALMQLVRIDELDYIVTARRWTEDMHVELSVDLLR